MIGQGSLAYCAVIPSCDSTGLMAIVDSPLSLQREHDDRALPDSFLRVVLREDVANARVRFAQHVEPLARGGGGFDPKLLDRSLRAGPEHDTIHVAQRVGNRRRELGHATFIVPRRSSSAVCAYVRSSPCTPTPRTGKHARLQIELRRDGAESGILGPARRLIGAQKPNRETGARKRLLLDQARRQTEGQPDLANLILIELHERLDNLAASIRRISSGTRLWWVLISADSRVPPDSIVSG